MSIGARYYLYFEAGKASSAWLSVPGEAYISRVGRLFWRGYLCLVSLIFRGSEGFFGMAIGVRYSLHLEGC